MKFRSDIFVIILIILSVLIVTAAYIPAIASEEEHIFKTYFGDEEGHLDTDYTRYFLPFYESTAEISEAGELPVWDPDRNINLFGNDMVSFPYFPYILGTVMFIPEIFMISIIFYLIIGGIAVFFIARRHFNISKTGGYLAAIIYMFCGQSVYMSSTGHTDMFHGIALLPFILYFTLNFFKAEDKKDDCR